MARHELKITNVRFPLDIHGRLVASAREAGRSLNAEILYRLASSFSLEGGELDEKSNTRARGAIFAYAGPSEQVLADLKTRLQTLADETAKIIADAGDGDISAEDLATIEAKLAEATKLDTQITAREKFMSVVKERFKSLERKVAEE
jgi:hypothetical protein